MLKLKLQSIFLPFVRVPCLTSLDKAMTPPSLIR